MQELPGQHPFVDSMTTAMDAGDVGAVRTLLEGRPELVLARVVDAHGTKKTWLHCAHDWPGHRPRIAEITQVLSELGVPLDAHATKPDGSRGETALHWAASSDDVVGIEALLAAGADLETPGAIFTDGTAMSDAVIFRQWNAAAELLKHGAATRPFEAAGLGLIDRLPLAALTQVEKDVSLWHAARNGRLEVVSALLAAGADPDASGPLDKTPRQVAADEGHAVFQEA